GTGATWIGYRDPWSGYAKVYVDGVLKATVNTYASTAKAQQRLYVAKALANGAHTLTVEALGRKSAASGGSWVWVDAFDAARVEQNSGAVVSTGSWAPNAQPM